MSKYNSEQADVNIKKFLYNTITQIKHLFRLLIGSENGVLSGVPFLFHYLDMNKAKKTSFNRVFGSHLCSSIFPSNLLFVDRIGLSRWPKRFRMKTQD